MTHLNSYINNSGKTIVEGHNAVFNLPKNRRQSPVKSILLALSASALLAACGGGGGDSGSVGVPPPSPPSSPPPPTALTCSFADQKQWARDYMQQSYLWYRNAPNPTPESYSDLYSYFAALQWKPTDRFSFALTEAEYQATFVQGKEFGFGASFVQEGGAGGAIRIKYVEPNSPAASAGLLRGDTVVRINGTPLTAPLDAASVALVNSKLFPSVSGTPINLGLRSAATGAERPVALVSQEIVVSPVLLANVVTATDGRKVGYIVFNTFIQTAPAQLRAVFAQLKQAGVSDLVLDLRYNGGGLVSVANELAAMIAGNAVGGKTFITYSHNDKLAPTYNRTEGFVSVAADTQLNLNRVFVLSTGRTASASELVINSLKPFVDVVQIGQVSYGKPVGQYPTTNCAQTFFAVNFETVNALNQGGYYSGIAPRCTVADNLNAPLGDVGEPMLASALSYRQTGTCPAATAVAKTSKALDIHLGDKASFGAMIGQR